MSIQRRFNFLKAAMASINLNVSSALSMDISPKSSIYMPENTTEKYQNIISLVAAGLAGKITAIGMLGLAADIEKEWEAIQAEAKAAAALVAPVTPPKDQINLDK